jgi:hypothetical protein
MCEQPSCYTETLRKARKEHRCCECRETIKPGDSYHYTSGIWDGRACSFKLCAKCEALRQYIFGEDMEARHEGLEFEGGAREWCVNCDEDFAELRDKVWQEKIAKEPTP